MSFTEKRLIGPTTLTTSASSALYTVPTGKTAIIKQIVATNTSASAVTFTLYIGSATASNAIFSGTSVSANDSLVINLSQVLSSAEVLRGLASSNSAINLTISGVENDGPLNPLSTYIADGAITQAKLASGISPTVSCTSATRPSSPAEGQMIYETDTDKVLFWDGSAWRYATTPQTLEPGAWTTWTPTITANSGTFTTTTVEKARYTRINNLIFGQLSVKINNIGTASGGMIFTAPVTISSQYGGGHAVGSWRESDVSGESGVIIVTSTTTMRMDMYNAGTYLNTNDAYRGSFTYEAA